MDGKIIYNIADRNNIPFMTSMLLEACSASGVNIDADKLSDFPETEVYIKGWIPEKEYGIVAKTDEGDPVGAVWMRYLPGSGHSIKEPLPEITIAVSDQYRNMGIATRLLECLYSICAENNINKLSLGVHRDNLPAISLYKKQGWKTDGYFKNYVMMSYTIK